MISMGQSCCLRALLLFVKVHSKQGDRIRLIFASWVIVNLGTVFLKIEEEAGVILATFSVQNLCFNFD
jgi:hypothetical protein